MRRIASLAGALALAAAGLLGFAGTATAAGGCPTGGDWTLTSTFVVIDELDNGNFADQNGDGLACFKVNKGQTDKHGGIPSYTWKDNTN